MYVKKLELQGLELVDPNADYSGTQTFFIDFDGANSVSYDNDALNIYIDNLSIAHSSLPEEEQFQIITDLNHTFAGTGVFFTVTAPNKEEYSTIYVGGNGSAFAEYGNFLGLSETIDVGNQIKNDEAFVFSDKINSTITITETIAHEAGHLIGFAHEDDITVAAGINDFAASSEPHFQWIKVDGVKTTNTSGSFTVQTNEEFWIEVDFENGYSYDRAGSVTMTLKYFDGSVNDYTWTAVDNDNTGYRDVVYKPPGSTLGGRYGSITSTYSMIEGYDGNWDTDYYEEDNILHVKVKATSYEETFYVQVRSSLYNHNAYTEYGDDWTVVSKAPDYSSKTDQQSWPVYQYTVNVEAPSLPSDLHIVDFDCENEGWRWGFQAQVDIDIENEGDEDANNVDIKLIASDDNILGNDDDYTFKTWYNQDISAGSHWKQTDYKWTLPESPYGNMPEDGSVYYFVHVETASGETDIADNYDNDKVSMSPAEEGSIISVSSPTFTGDQPTVVTVRVHNKGLGDDMLIIASNVSAGWTVIALKDKNALGDCNPYLDHDEYYNATFEVTPPVDGGNGSIKWEFRDDDVGTANDLLDDETQPVSAIASKPDLSIQNVYGTGSSYTTTDKLHAYVDVKNIGEATASSSKVDYYLGTSSNATYKTIESGSFGAIYEDDTETDEINYGGWNIPDDVDDGTYYVYCHTTTSSDDPNDSSTYSSTSNNWGRSSSFAITVPKEIISAYWWDYPSLGQTTASEGTEVTLCAEVQGYGIGDRFRFDIYENDGAGISLGSNDKFVTTIYGDVYSDNNKTYVKSDWETTWQEDEIGEPEYIFTVSRDSVSETSRNEMNVNRISPSITNITVNSIDEDGDGFASKLTFNITIDGGTEGIVGKLAMFEDDFNFLWLNKDDPLTDINISVTAEQVKDYEITLNIADYYKLQSDGWFGAFGQPELLVKLNDGYGNTIDSKDKGDIPELGSLAVELNEGDLFDEIASKYTYIADKAFDEYYSVFAGKPVFGVSFGIDVDLAQIFADVTTATVITQIARFLDVSVGGQANIFIDLADLFYATPDSVLNDDKDDWITVWVGGDLHADLGISMPELPGDYIDSKLAFTIQSLSTENSYWEDPVWSLGVDKLATDFFVSASAEMGWFKANASLTSEGLDFSLNAEGMNFDSLNNQAKTTVNEIRTDKKLDSINDFDKSKFELVSFDASAGVNFSLPIQFGSFEINRSKLLGALVNFGYELTSGFLPNFNDLVDHATDIDYSYTIQDALLDIISGNSPLIRSVTPDNEINNHPSIPQFELTSGYIKNNDQTNDSTPQFDWSDSVDDDGISKYELVLNNKTTGKVYSFDSINNYSNLIVSEITDGSYTAKVQGYDDSSQHLVSGWSEIINFTVDTVDPTIHVLYNSSSQELEWSINDDRTDIADFGVTHSLPISLDINQTSGSVDLSGLNPDSYQLTAWAIDGAGNRTDRNIAFTIGDNEDPTDPGNPTATVNDDNRVSFFWGTSSDNVQVSGYHVSIWDKNAFSDIYFTSDTSLQLYDLSDGAYSWEVWAKDTSMNTSTKVSGNNFSINPEIPEVSIFVLESNAAEPATGGLYRITRSGGDTDSSLTVNFSVSGTANQRGQIYAMVVDYYDYELRNGLVLDNSVTIAAGETSAYITLDVIDDSIVEDPESVILTLAGNSDYEISSSYSATITISDNDVFSHPDLEVSANSYDFGSSETSWSFNIGNVGDGTLNYSISEISQSWLQVAGYDGYATSPNEDLATVTINRGLLSAGTNIATITIVNSNDSSDKEIIIISTTSGEINLQKPIITDISFDNRTLNFASIMPDGVGKYEVWGSFSEDMTGEAEHLFYFVENGSYTDPGDWSDGNKIYMQVRSVGENNDYSDWMKTSFTWHPSGSILDSDIISPDAISGMNHVVVVNGLATMDWSDSVDSGSGIKHYNIQVDNNSDFSSPEYAGSVDNSTLRLSELVSETYYCWRVQAEDNAGNNSVWSEVRGYYVDGEATAIEIGSSVISNIGYAKQESFLLNLTSAQTEVVIETSAAVGSSDMLTDTVLYLYDSELVLIGSNDDFGDDYYSRITLDELAAGEYHIVVEGCNSPDWGDYQLSVQVSDQAPSVPTDLNSEVFMRANDVNLDWEDSLGATKYNIQVDNNNDFSSPEFSGGWPADSDIFIEDLNDGEYSWRVQACNEHGYSDWAQGEAFNIDTLAAVPAGMNVNISGNDATLSWNAVSDLSGILRYEYYLDDNTDFSSPIAHSGTSDTTFSVADLSDGTYYWKVCSVDNAHNYSDWSTANSFSIMAIEQVYNDTEQLIIPQDVGSNMRIDSNGSQLITAELVYNSDTMSYDGALYVYDHGDFSAPAQSITVDGVSAFGDSIDVCEQWLVATDEPGTGAGNIYIYNNTSGAWALNQTISSAFNTSGPGDIEVYDDLIGVISRNGINSSVEFYYHNDATWQQMQSLDFSNFKYALKDVAINEDWVFIGTGTDWSGDLPPMQTYVYKQNGSELISYGTLEKPEEFNSIGSYIAVDGDFAAVSAATSNSITTENHAVLIYKLENDAWNLFQTIDAPTVSFYENITISGDTLIVANHGDKTLMYDGFNPVENGSQAYVYKYDGTSWNYSETLLPDEEYLREGDDQYVAMGGGYAYYHSANQVVSVYEIEADPDETAPTVPTGLLQAVSEGSVALDWGDSSGATKYNIQVDNNSDFSSPEFSGGWPSVSNISVSNLNDGEYSWRVQACNEHGYSDWVQGESFTIKASTASNDFDGNGKSDILLSHHAGFSGAWQIDNTGGVAWSNFSTMTGNWQAFATGNANGDDYSDIYLHDLSSGQIGVWLIDSGSVIGWQSLNTLGSSTNLLGIGDFNGDGMSDELLQNDNGAVGTWLSDGTGWSYFASLGSEWSLSGIGDYNGDGIDDVILRHDAGFAGTWLVGNDGTPGWANLDTLSADQSIEGSGDFNGDGIDDILLRNSNGYIGAWLVEEGSVASWMGLGNLDAGTVIEDIGDYNGDGVDDLRVRSDQGAIGALLVNGADDLNWEYYGSVGDEWTTCLTGL